MKALRIAAAAAIALAPFLVVATTPVVAQAAQCAGLGTDPKNCQWQPFSVAQYRISTDPTLPGPAPTTVTPVQTPQVVAPTPPPPNTIPVVAAGEEPTQPTQPWWHPALQYMALVIVMSLIAWPLGSSSNRTTDTPPIPPRPKSRRAGRGALAVRSALSFPTIDHQCADIRYDQNKEIDRQPIQGQDMS
jgi:hypothetical protein